MQAQKLEFEWNNHILKGFLTQMNITEFIENFASQFDDTEPDAFASDTKFKQLDEWSSLTALSIIAMIDDEYGVVIKGDELRSAKTIMDVYNIVSQRA